MGARERQRGIIMYEPSCYGLDLQQNEAQSRILSRAVHGGIHDLRRGVRSRAQENAWEGGLRSELGAIVLRGKREGGASQMLGSCSLVLRSYSARTPLVARWFFA